jgi:hypothetical protein
MKSFVMLAASMFVMSAHAGTVPGTLNCTAKIQISGQAKTESFDVSERMSKDNPFPDLYSADTEKLSADGRFKIDFAGYQDISNPSTVRLTVFIYDAKTKTGAQAGDPGVDSLASGVNDLIYVFDTNGKPGPPKNFVSTHCEIQ